jgi:hypothetical protein
MQDITRRAADIKAAAGTAPIPLPIPPEVPPHLIDGVELVPRDEALRKTQRHRSVVGPLPGSQMKWPAPDLSLIGYIQEVRARR